MKKSYLILVFFLFLLASCGSRVMTMDDYSDVSIGMSVEKLKKEMGKPYQIHEKEKGYEEYEYIEKITGGGGRVIQERHYYFCIYDGKVHSKRISYVDRPFNYRNSFDLQTSSRG